VKKYPIFFGLMLLPVNPGLVSGGVGSCSTGRGIEAPLTSGSVTPGIDGMRELGIDICLLLTGVAGEANATDASAIKASENLAILWKLMLNKDLAAKIDDQEGLSRNEQD
jgi:hypothetical protein